MRQYYHLAIATDWEYDADYVQLLERTAQRQGLSSYVIWPGNLDNVVHQIENGNIDFGFYYDRASDTSLEFLKLQSLMIQNHVPVFDNLKNLKWAADKAIMHIEFTSGGIHTPYTLIIPPYKSDENIFLSEEILSPLEKPFIAKPANTVGGGQGVIKEARTIEDVLRARKTFPSQRYLLQRKIIPIEKNGRRFWFRGFYTCGLVQAAWWNDHTHSYDLITEEELEKYILEPLFGVIEKIAYVCKVNFFSTEITVGNNGEFTAIDYVNEVCDMRLKSRHYDGVPDEIVEKIVNRIVSYVNENFVYSEKSLSR